MNTAKYLKKAQAGNEEAFLKLLELEKKKLYRMAYTYVRNETDALDIVQETVFKAYSSIGSVKEASYFSTWLTRILINSALDFIRKSSKVVPIGQELLEQVEDGSSASTEDALDLQEAIGRLDEKYKTVLLLRFYRDLTVPQIADVLECPEGTVKTQLHRAINQLRMEYKGGCINE